MMQIPCLEILGGRLVSCPGGPNTGQVLSEDPVAVARELGRQGAVFFQVVDLDGRLGTGDNDPVLERLGERGICYQLAGGIHTPERAERLLALGADRLVLGAISLQRPDEARDLVRVHGRRVMVGLPSRFDPDTGEDQVALGGKPNSAPLELTEAVSRLATTGADSLVFQRLHQDPTQEDFDGAFAALVTVLGCTDMEVFAQIDVRSKEHMQRVKQLHGGTEPGAPPGALAGVVLGPEYWGAAIPPEMAVQPG